jgi:hypothetical protein
MRNAWLLALLMSALSAANAAWVFLGFDNGNAAEYYDPSIDNKGQTAVVRSFSQKTVKDMVPIYDPKKPEKYTLILFRSEQSSYEFNCKENTIQLVSRTFYHDVQGHFPIITHAAKDKAIEEGNSDFARQFRKSDVNPRSGKNTRLMALACKGKK